MDLSSILTRLIKALQKHGWQTCVEDDHPDFKQISSKIPSGLLGAFTRLDTIILIPEPIPAQASGVSICFVFFADPSKVSDMFSFGRIIRQDESNALRSHCGLILSAANIMLANPSIKVVTRPTKDQRITFNNDQVVQPAFVVELAYWLSSEKASSENQNSIVFSGEDIRNRLEDSRVEAILALQGSDLSETEDILLNAVSDSDTNVKMAALKILSEYGDSKHIPVFEDVLQSGEEPFRQFCGEYLKTFAKHFRHGPVFKTKPSMNECLAALSSTNDFDRERAVENLVGETDPLIIQPLLRIIKNSTENYWCQLYAIDALTVFDCPEIMDVFNSLLGDEKLGATIAYKLKYKCNPVADQYLLNAFFSGDPIAKFSVTPCVRCNDDVLEELCNMVLGSDIKLRNVAMDRISSVLAFTISKDDRLVADACEISNESTKSITTALLAAAKDEDEDIRGKAIESLCLIDKSRGTEILKEALKEFLHSVLGENFKDNADPYHIDWYSRYLFSAIDVIGTEMFTDSLHQLLKSNSWKVRLDAAAKLIDSADGNVNQILKEALCHGDFSIRSDAARILFEHGDGKMWEILLGLIYEEINDPLYFKYGIIETMMKSCDPRVVDTFCDVLNCAHERNVDDMLVGYIIKQLSEIGDSRAIEPIRRWQYRELINCEDGLVEKALETLGWRCIVGH